MVLTVVGLGLGDVVPGDFGCDDVVVGAEVPVVVVEDEAVGNAAPGGSL